MAVGYKDYYAILGVPRTATSDEIRKAHRKLARQHHPDLNPGDKQSEATFKEIQEAYEVLSDDKKRQRYDQLGANWQAGPEFRPPPRGGPFSEEDRNGFFDSDRSGRFSDFFESLFGGRHAGFRTSDDVQIRGRDIEVEVPISLEEANAGTRRSLTLEVEEPCPECGGSGTKDRRPCPACGGSGVRPARKTLEVTIPAGVRDGVLLRLAGQGEAGSGGGPSGDVRVHVRLLPHRRFAIKGDYDLLLELPVAPWEAVLGTRLPIETLDGQVELTIPAGSQNGQKLRLRGQGLRTREGRRGDLFVRLKVLVPTRPTNEEKELFERLAAVSTFRPR
jgi:DnaJ-class molecular chaperone